MSAESLGVCSAQGGVLEVGQSCGVAEGQTGPSEDRNLQRDMLVQPGSAGDGAEPGTELPCSAGARLAL